MTLDQAIEHCNEVAEEQERKAQSIGRQLIGSAIAKYQNECVECATSHRQLAEWLKELQELRKQIDIEANHNHCLEIELAKAKELLKLALEDMNILYETGKDEGCYGIKFKWRYADEIERLLKG